MANPNDQTLLFGITMDHNFPSDALIITRNEAFSFQATWTGNPTGIWTIEQSCFSAQDPLVKPPDPQWNPIITNPAGGQPGSLTLSWSIPIPFNWVRMRYTFTSGTGLLIALNFNGR